MDTMRLMSLFELLLEHLLVVCICHQKHYHANCDQFAPNFDMAYKTIQCVIVSNLKLCGPTRTQLMAKEIEEISIILL